MLKILGILLVLTGSVGSGISLVQGLNRRIVILRSMTEGLSLLGHELEFGRVSLKDALSAASNKASAPAMKLFQICANKIDEDYNILFRDVWSQELAASFPELKHCDMESMLTVGAVLGRYDVENQLCVIRTSAEQLRRYLEEAVQEKATKGKVYGSICIASGLLMIVLLV